MQLQRSLPDVKRRGLGLVAISYDSTTTLKAFSDARGITYPLLSDTGSTVIGRYKILNEQAEGRTAGIPHPGTFVIDARARV
ncbi:MAG: peroxiredoxin family protein, partial [Acidobacteria bacterium]|nr:peroxiredoxin family protein [Acidobacteriota bacterium]